MKKIFISALFIICTVSCNQPVFAEGSMASVDGQTVAQSLTKEDRIFGLVTIYSAAKQHFAYFERVPDLNWDNAFKEYLPLVEKEQNSLQYYRTLQKFTALLQDGHTGVSLPEQVEIQLGRLPFRLEYIQNKWVVTERMPTEGILQEDIPVGSILLTIEGTPANEYIGKEFFPYLAHGTLQGKRTGINWEPFFQKEQEVNISLKYPDGSIHSRTVHANRKKIMWNKELRRKYISVLYQGPYFSTKMLPGDILYVRYRQCTNKTEEDFCEFIEKMEIAPKAIILDLRRNPGGATPLHAVQHLIFSPIQWYPFKTRWSISYINAQMSSQSDKRAIEGVFENQKKFMELPDAINLNWFKVIDEKRKISPAEKNYKGKLLILIDNETGSAAEDMVVLLQASGRATIIGELSAGSTGQPLMIDLPGGGECRICTVNCTYPDGKKLRKTAIYSTTWQDYACSQRCG